MQMLPKRGKSLEFSVNGTTRIGAGRGRRVRAFIYMNAVGINTPLKVGNYKVTVEPSTEGAAAR